MLAKISSYNFLRLSRQLESSSALLSRLEYSIRKDSVAGESDLTNPTLSQINFHFCFSFYAVLIFFNSFDQHLATLKTTDILIFLFWFYKAWVSGVPLGKSCVPLCSFSSSASSSNIRVWESSWAQRYCVFKDFWWSWLLRFGNCC